MSLVYCESFDGLDWNLGRVVNTYSGNTTATGGPHGTYLQTFQQQIHQVALKAADEHATIIMGAMIYHKSAATADDGNSTAGFFRFYGDGGTTTHVTITKNPTTGAIIARRGAGNGTILGTSATGVFPNDTWVHVEAKVVLHDSTGSVEVRVDGSVVLNLTSQDTKNGGTASVFSRLALGASHNGGGSPRLFDSWIILNGVSSGVTGALNNDFIGPSRVFFSLPDGDGTPENWSLSSGSDSYALTDEATPNGDTDYIYSSSTAVKTQLTMTDTTGITGYDVLGAQTVIYAKKADAGSASFRAGLYSSSAADNGGDWVLGESYLTYVDQFDGDSAGNQLTPTTLNASEVFVETRT